MSKKCDDVSIPVGTVAALDGRTDGQNW